jgi:hypothetical protein
MARKRSDGGTGSGERPRTDRARAPRVPPRPGPVSHQLGGLNAPPLLLSRLETSLSDPIVSRLLKDHRLVLSALSSIRYRVVRVTFAVFSANVESGVGQAAERPAALRSCHPRGVDPDVPPVAGGRRDPRCRHGGAAPASVTAPQSGVRHFAGAGHRIQRVIAAHVGGAETAGLFLQSVGFMDRSP